jgi:hypothetical protein
MEENTCERRLAAEGGSLDQVFLRAGGALQPHLRARRSLRSLRSGSVVKVTFSPERENM